MKVLWTYLKPFQKLITIALVLAGVAQVLSLYDPVIFGKIIDNYALNPDNKPEKELVTGILWLLLLAVGVALAARLARTFQEYVCRFICYTTT